MWNGARKKGGWHPHRCHSTIICHRPTRDGGNRQLGVALGRARSHGHAMADLGHALDSGSDPDEHPPDPFEGHMTLTGA